MKYPKLWPASNQITVHSRQTEGVGKKVYGVTLRIQKPGTSHHERRVCAELTRNEMVALHAQIESLIKVEG